MIEWIQPEPMLGIVWAIALPWITAALTAIGVGASIYFTVEGRDDAKKAAKKELALKEKALQQTFATSETFAGIAEQKVQADAAGADRQWQIGILVVTILAVLFVLMGKK